jgi:hypothetical protein
MRYVEIPRHRRRKAGADLPCESAFTFYRDKLGKHERNVMPKTDYTDQEILFPRLEAPVHKTDKDAFHIHIWIWDRPGDGRSGERREIMNGKRAGSIADITDMIYSWAREHSVAVGAERGHPERFPLSRLV